MARLTGWMTSHTVLTGRQRQTQQWKLSDGPSRQIQFHWPAAVRPLKGLEMGRRRATQWYVQFWLSVIASYDYDFSWAMHCKSKLHVRTTLNICLKSRRELIYSFVYAEEVYSPDVRIKDFSSLFLKHCICCLLIFLEEILHLSSARLVWYCGISRTLSWYSQIQFQADISHTSIFGH